MGTQDNVDNVETAWELPSDEALRKWNIKNPVQAKQADYESLITCVRKGLCE